MSRDGVLFFKIFFSDHLGLYYTHIYMAYITYEGGDENGARRVDGEVSRFLCGSVEFVPHFPGFPGSGVFVFLPVSLDHTLQWMRCGGRPVRLLTVQESYRSA